MVLVLRGGRRDGRDAEEDVRVGLGQPVHDVAALVLIGLIALGGKIVGITGERVLAPAHLRQPRQPEVRLLRRDGGGRRAKELARLGV